MSSPDRLAIRREPDKSFTLLGAVTAATKTEVTVISPAGVSETHARKAVIFVTFGSLNHFARLHPEALTEALGTAPQVVFEQALVDAPGVLTVSALKGKLTQAGLHSGAVDDAWKTAKKALEANPDVKVTKEGSTNKYSWKGERSSRLGVFVPVMISSPGEAPPEPEPTDSRAVQVDGREVPLPPDPAEAVGGGDELPEPALPNHDETTVAADDLLLTVLQAVLGESAPASISILSRSVLRTGAELSAVPEKELRRLVDVPEDQRLLVTLLLMARDRELTLWRDEIQALPSAVASAAVQSAIGETARNETNARSLARFAVRVFRRTELSEIPLPLLASTFVKASALESGGKPSKSLVEVAGALANRTKSSVAQEWDVADALIADIARGMNRLHLDEDGPRSRFLAALFEIRRKHLDGDLLWKNIDIDGLDLAAGGVMRRALLDPDLEERVVKPEVKRLVEDCTTRHDLGKVIALRGAFAKYVDASAVVTAMRRVAKDDPKASEWFVGLRQQNRVDEAEMQRDQALAEASRNRAEVEAATTRLEKAIIERDTANAALNQASQANAEASDAQLRQAKLDVLRSLSSLALTIKGSAAAKDDPALLQRVDFALRREGLTPIAESGETVRYDPVLHDAQGTHIDPGAPVSVGREGYTYDSGEETLVLVKAHVSTK